MEANDHLRRRKEVEKNNPETITTIQHLPQDVLRDILLRLPVPSLLSLKGVGPSWRALISGSEFIKQHLDQANNGGGNVGLCEVFGEIYAFDHPNFTVNLTIIDRKASETKRAIKVLSDFNHLGEQVKILGSCDGLLLILVSFVNLLWNPTTGEYIKVANHCWEERVCDDHYKWENKDYDDYYAAVCIYGLGYDSCLDEYKAVFLAFQHERYTDQYENEHWRKIGSSMFICRTSVGSWNKVDDGVHDFGTYCSNAMGITVNGSPHWVVSDTKEDNVSPYQTIVYFDMADEKFKRLPTPLLLWGKISRLEIAVLDGCVVCSTGSDGYKDFNVWMMKKYGVVESWAKLFVIEWPPPLTWVMTPLGCTNNGSEVLLHANLKILVSYNINTHEEKLIRDSKTFSMALYVQSLVSPAYAIKKIRQVEMVFL